MIAGQRFVRLFFYLLRCYYYLCVLLKIEMKDTNQQFKNIITICRDLFAKKLHDYGAAWRILRPISVTDQIFIKANRLRSIETKGVSMVRDGILSAFNAIVMSGVI